MFPISFIDFVGLDEQTLEFSERFLKEELDNKTHVCFYLVNGPRVFNYTFLKILFMLFKLNTYNIHYYLIKTKEKEENNLFNKQTQNFFNKFISKYNDESSNEYKFIKDNKMSIKNLEEIRDQLENRTFSIDLLEEKSNSKSINELLIRIKKDLNENKEIHNKFIRKVKEINYKFDFSDIKKELITPFFYGKIVDKSLNKKKEAEKVLKEIEDVSFWKKLIFSFNSELETKKKEMIEKLKNIYSCIDLKISINDNKWFYQTESIKELGEKLINIFDEEYKNFELKKFINDCIDYNYSIDEFSKYTEHVINMKINDKFIAYDVDLI